MADIPKIRFKGFTEPWEQRKLKDVVDFLDTMRKPLEGAKRIPGPYPYYGASGIVDYVDGYLFDEELVLLSEDGANITDRNYPVCFLASGKYWVNNHAHVLRTKDGNENNFICNSLERKDYKQYNSGMAMPKLNKEVCQSIPISCPRFDEQKKIGDYFRNLDHLITLHQRKCDDTKELKKYMLQKMFPKNGEKFPEIRFKGFTEAWEQRKLGEVLKERTERAKGDEELLSVTIANGVIRQIDSEKRNTASEDRSNYKIVKKGDVPYNSMRMWQGAVGNSKYNGIVSPAYTILTPTSEANGKFFMELFKKKSTLQIFQRWSQGLTSDTWNLKYPILSSIQFAIPSVEEQEKIAEYFSHLDNLITLHQRKCDTLKELKKYMLQNMFPKKG